MNATDIAVKATDYQIRNGVPPHGAEISTTDYRDLLEGLVGKRVFGASREVVAGRSTTPVLFVGGLPVYANDAVPEGDVWLLVPR